MAARERIAARRLGHALGIVQDVLDGGGARQQVHHADATSALTSTRCPDGDVSSIGRRRLLATRRPSVRSQAGDWIVSTRDTKQRS